jgi:expansin (peptidoglycan-binding protein)
MQLARCALGSSREDDKSMHEAPGSRFRRPWVIITFAAIGVIALGVAVIRFAPPSCAMAGQSVRTAAAAPNGTGPASGEALYYNPAGGGDRCSIEPLARDGLYVGLPAARYGNGALCGAYLEVTGPHGTVQAEITDLCPGCNTRQIDLSTAAFAAIQPLSKGTARVGYQLVTDPSLPGPLAVRVGPGSDAGSLAIQILNHGNPLSGVQVNGKRLSSHPDGHWVASGGAGSGPFTVRVTDTLGDTAVLTGIRLRPGALQQTAVLMYGSPTPPPTPTPTPTPAGTAAGSGASSVARQPSVTVSPAASRTTGPGC